MAADAVEEAMDSPLRSTLNNAEDPQVNSTSYASRLQRSGEPLQSPLAEAENSRVVRWILRRRWQAEAMRRTSVAARATEAALCLIAFSVMAADKDRGWASDSFDRYKEYRYCLSVNVIGFVYAGFQAYAELSRLISKKHMMRRPMGDCFDFAMDQVLTYLLISASSSAAAHNNFWMINWGEDPFPSMISGSIAVSFLAFVVFALSSIISTYKIFNRTI
ncbi:CASP-like protein [Apostasia shenzhenica]|uniref:CASP-like protein n=1 Tax=Apostasia shenzhenica TaxID=1088818 RepID=A0A2I0A175_9ASPA|nr:CASP-like protein [Apostasia shenzhenica]